jgi:Protein of unknown function (DUF3352)
MRAIRAFGAVLALGASALVAGCGGEAGTNAALPAGASTVPDNAAAFISVVSKLDAPQVQQAESLISRFPAGKQALTRFQQFKQTAGPALGDELDLVWLDFANDGNDVVGLTQPKDQAKFDALVAKSDNPPVHEIVDGWTVVAQDQATIDKYKEQQANTGSLSDSGDFQHALGDLPEDSLARAYVSGNAIRTQIDAAIARGGVPPAVAQQIPAIESLGAALTAHEDAVQVDATASGDLKVNPTSFHPELPAELPAGAIAYAGFSNLEDSLRRAIHTVGKTRPNFDQQRAQIEAALGLSLDDDVLPLFAGEGALAVYPSAETQVPTIAFVVKVSDEEAARHVISRLTALGQLGAAGRVTTVPIGGVEATQISVGNGVSIYVAEFAHKIVVTNSRTTISDMQGTGPKLSDDPAYTGAVAAAGAPDETVGFLYVNAHDGLRYAFSYFAKRTGQTVAPEVLANTDPLQSLLLSTSKEGDQFRFSGFLGIQ